MNIVTISREFGSGGRELGKRLADALGVPCYDREIIDLLSERENLDKKYLEQITEAQIQTFYPSTIGQRFHVMPPLFYTDHIFDIQQKEQKLLRELAEKGDCVFVGRCADIVLQDLNPFKIFVYAETSSKLLRCQQRAAEGENLSEREICKKMKEIDNRRKRFRAQYTAEKWGVCSTYHLCINTSQTEIKTLIPGLAMLTKAWFQTR